MQLASKAVVVISLPVLTVVATMGNVIKESVDAILAIEVMTVQSDTC